MPTHTISSKASSTPAFTIATIKTALSKYSCSGMLTSPAAVFSKPVSAVSARHVSRFLSLLSQSAIMVDEKTPVMMSS